MPTTPLNTDPIVVKKQVHERSGGGASLRRHPGLALGGQNAGQVTENGRSGCFKPGCQPPRERFTLFTPYIPCGGRPERLITVMKVRKGHT
jgi:hypothetical protein